jgi:hypothetical protein
VRVQQADGRVEQGQVDQLAKARVLAFAQRKEDAREGEDPGDDVDKWDADA